MIAPLRLFRPTQTQGLERKGRDAARKVTSVHRASSAYLNRSKSRVLRQSVVRYEHRLKARTASMDVNKISLKKLQEAVRVIEQKTDEALQEWKDHRDAHKMKKSSEKERNAYLMGRLHGLFVARREFEMRCPIEFCEAGALLDISDNHEMTEISDTSTRA